MLSRVVITNARYLVLLATPEDGYVALKRRRINVPADVRRHVSEPYNFAILDKLRGTWTTYPKLPL